MELQTVETLLLPFYGIIVIVGICGNSLFITVVRKRRSMQTAVNFLLTNVAVSDIISLVFCMPGITLRLFSHPGGILGNFLCKFVTTHLIAGITLLVSGLTLTVISVERHNALLRPMASRFKLNGRRTKAMICLIWGFSIAFVLPLFIHQTYKEEIQNCYLDWDKIAAVTYWACLATVLGISLSVVCFCYFRIISALYLNKIIPPNQGNRIKQDNEDKRKILKLLLTVTGLFIVCFLPFVVVSAISNISAFSALYQVSYFLVYCNCCVNPVVYIFQSSNYRAGLKDLWNKRRACQRERSRQRERPHDLRSQARMESHL